MHESEDVLARRSEGCGCPQCVRAYESFLEDKAEWEVEDRQLLRSTIMFLSATFWMMRMPAQHAYKIGEDGDLIPIPNKLYDDGDMNNLWLGGTPDD